MPTHYEMSQAKAARGGRECKAHDINFGGGCFNCGFVPASDFSEKCAETYNIVRYFKVSGRRRILHRGVTLEVARLHCNDKRTKRDGVWFDGYEKRGK